MKKTTLILIALVTIAALAGCAPQAAAPVTADAAAEGLQARQLPLSTQLMVGTLKLEGSAQSVTAEQAVALLPLWKGYLAVSKSDSASRQELDGVANQIAESMTKEQLAAIDAMGLSGTSMGELMQELGIELGSGLSEEDRAAAQAQRAASGGGGGGGGGGFGGGPGGGPGALPGGMPGGNVENISPQQIETAQAMRAAGGGAFGGNTLLVEKLIEVLAAK